MIKGKVVANRDKEDTEKEDELEAEDWYEDDEVDSDEDEELDEEDVCSAEAARRRRHSL
jgi:hypothetical protein